MSARRAFASVALVGVFAIGRPAAAQTVELRHDLGLDTALTIGLAAATGFAIVTREAALGPKGCTWCGTNGFDLGARNALQWSNMGLAADMSDAGLLVVVPAMSIGSQIIVAASDGRSEDIGVNVLLTLEAVAATAAFTELVKLVVARERPSARMNEWNPKSRGPIDDHLSFFSGHTSVTTAFATASGTIASMRGYTGSQWVFVAGGVPAITTGYLRIAADRHWLSDVLVGAGVGIAMGALVPLVFHPVVPPPAPTIPTGASAARPLMIPIVAGTW